MKWSGVPNMHIGIFNYKIYLLGKFQLCQNPLKLWLGLLLLLGWVKYRVQNLDQNWV